MFRLIKALQTFKNFTQISVAVQAHNNVLLDHTFSESVAAQDL